MSKTGYDAVGLRQIASSAGGAPGSWHAILAPKSNYYVYQTLFAAYEADSVGEGDVVAEFADGY